MKRKTIVITAVILLIFMMATVVGSAFYGIVFAETDEELAEKARQEQEETQEKIDANQEEQGDMLAYKGQLDENINSLHLELESLEKTIVSTQTEIDKLEVDLEQAQERISVQDDLMKKRVRVMYEDGALGYLDVLLSAKSFSDLMNRIEAIKTITEYDANLLNSFEEAKKTVEEDKALVEQHKQSLEAARGNKEQKQGELENQLSLAQAEIDRLSEEEDTLRQALEAAQAAEAEANQRIAEALAAAEAAAAAQAATSNNEDASTSVSSNTDTSNDVYVPSSGGQFIFPFDRKYVITSGYGYRSSPIFGSGEFHTGLDIGAPYGTTIRASAAGTVVISGWNNGGYGNYVVINHGNGYSTLYAHASMNLVQAGQTVVQGQAIAEVGSTGWSTGPHLHFEIRINNAHVNPSGYVL
ncbi:MAG: hypothetical protein E7399_01710 [Ruminococcaceae bacterium]|nr:hypothetical protein [Oscillospiraceae bacterium]